MPREPRPEFPNGLYHVINRGIERRPIVRDDEDRKSWFRLLDRVVKRYAWRVFAYTLMDNHFHLFFRIRQANLSIGMQDFTGSYATLFNQRHQRVGPLFQGRFKSILVENESYSWELSRYVHLNSVRAHRVDNPLAYRWSSYRFYLNPQGAPAWLDWQTVLGEFSGTEAASRLAYKRFIEAGIKEPPPDILEQVVDGWLLGSAEFVERMRALVATTAESRLAPSVEEVIEAAANTMDVPEGHIVRPGKRINQPREAALLLARELTGLTNAALGEAFGIGASGVTETVRRACERVGRDKGFEESVDAVRKTLLE